MQAASGGGNSSEVCQRCARPSSLLISCPVQLRTFICCDGNQEVEPLLALQILTQSANLSLSFFSNANVRLSFSEWTRRMSRSPPPPTTHHLDMSDRAGGSHGSGTLLHPYSRRQRGIYYLKHFLCSLYDWCDSWPQNSLLTFVTPPSCDREDNMAAKSWATHGSRAAPHQTCFCMCFKHWERFPHDLHHRKRFPVSADKQEVKRQPGRLQTSSWSSFRKLTELLSTNMNFAVVVLCTLASVNRFCRGNR